MLLVWSSCTFDRWYTILLFLILFRNPRSKCAEIAHTPHVVCTHMGGRKIVVRVESFESHRCRHCSSLDQNLLHVHFFRTKRLTGFASCISYGGCFPTGDPPGSGNGPQTPMYISNPDFLFAAAYPEPRFAAVSLTPTLPFYSISFPRSWWSCLQNDRVIITYWNGSNPTSIHPVAKTYARS